MTPGGMASLERSTSHILSPNLPKVTIALFRDCHSVARRRWYPTSNCTITTAAERLQGSSMTADFRRDSARGVESTKVQIYAVSGER